MGLDFVTHNTEWVVLLKNEKRCTLRNLFWWWLFSIFILIFSKHLNFHITFVKHWKTISTNNFLSLSSFNRRRFFTASFCFNFIFISGQIVDSNGQEDIE